MRIDRGPQALVLLAFIRAPALTIADEESLLWSKFVNRLQLLSLGVVLPRHVSEDQAAHVGDILTQRQFAVDLDVVNDGIRRVLLGDARGPLHKLLPILRGPPVAKIPLRIELPAFGVDAMRALG